MASRKQAKALKGRVIEVALTIDDRPFKKALRSLSDLAERSPEVVKRFLRGRNAVAKLFRVDRDVLPTSRAGELRIVLEPTDRLVKFLAAAGAGNV